MELTNGSLQLLPIWQLTQIDGLEIQWVTSMFFLFLRTCKDLECRCPNRWCQIVDDAPSPFIALKIAFVDSSKA